MSDPATTTLAQAAADAPENLDPAVGDNRTRIARRADFVRHKLMRTVTAIRAKGQDAADVGQGVRRGIPTVAVVSAVAAFGLGGAAVALVATVSRRRARRTRVWTTLVTAALALAVTEVELRRARAHPRSTPP